jgi:hypothetical protein
MDAFGRWTLFKTLTMLRGILIISLSTEEKMCTENMYNVYPFKRRKKETQRRQCKKCRHLKVLTSNGLCGRC